MSPSVIQSVSHLIQNALRKPGELPSLNPQPETVTNRLLPVMIVMGGRSGSTLVMELLSGDPRCALERVFPFEAKYIGWFAKTAALMDGWRFHEFGGDLREQALNVYPTFYRLHADDKNLVGLPSGRSIFVNLWETFRESVLAKSPASEFYLEKTGCWVTPYIRQYIEAQNVYLFRDPRDRFLSLRAFTSDPTRFTTAKKPGDTDMDLALSLARRYYRDFENWRLEPDPQQTGSVRYEELIRDPDTALEQVRRMTGISPTNQSSFQHYENHRTSKNPSSSVDRWKTEELEPELRNCLEAILQDVIVDLGYEFDPAKTTPIPTIYFDNQHPVPALTHGDGIIERVTERGVHMKPTGPFCHIDLPFEPFNATDVSELWVCMNGEVGTSASVFWRNSIQSFQDTREVQEYYDPARHYYILRFSLKNHAQWRGRIHQLRLNIFNGQGWDRDGKQGYIRWIRLIPTGFNT